MRLLPGPARFEAVDEGIAEANAEAARKAREDDQQSDLIAKIVAFVADEKESPSGRAIEREHLGPKDAVYRALRAACKAGRLEKVPAKGKAGGGNVYRVPHHALSSPQSRRSRSRKISSPRRRRGTTHELILGASGVPGVRRCPEACLF